MTTSSNLTRDLLLRIKRQQSIALERADERINGLHAQIVTMATLLEHSCDAITRRDETIARLTADSDQWEATARDDARRMVAQHNLIEEQRRTIASLRRSLREADAAVEWSANAEGLR